MQTRVFEKLILFCHAFVLAYFLSGIVSGTLESLDEIVIGIAPISGIDPKSRIRSYFLLVFGTLLLGRLAASFWKPDNILTRNRLWPLAGIVAMQGLLDVFNLESSLRHSHYLGGLATLLLVSVFALRPGQAKPDAKTIERWLLMALGLLVFNEMQDARKLSGQPLVAGLFLLAFLAICAGYFFRFRRNTLLALALGLTLAAGFGPSLLLEATIIAGNRSATANVLIGLTLLGLAGFVLWRILRQNPARLWKLGEAAVLFLFGFFFFFDQGPEYLVWEGSELGNRLIPLHLMYNYGQLPLLDFFVPHVFADFLGPLLYNIVYNDFDVVNGLLFAESAVHNGGIERAAVFVIAYYLLRRITGLKGESLYFLGATPFLLVLIPDYYAFALIVVFFRKGQGAWRLLTAVLLGLYRIDLGAAALIATVVLLIMERELPRVRKQELLAAAGLAALALLGVLVYDAGLFAKGLRFLEYLLAISALEGPSNAFKTWYTEFHPGVPFFYFFMLLGVLAVIAFVRGLGLPYRRRTLLIFACAFYLAVYSRALLRNGWQSQSTVHYTAFVFLIVLIVLVAFERRFLGSRRGLLSFPAVTLVMAFALALQVDPGPARPRSTAAINVARHNALAAVQHWDPAQYRETGRRITLRYSHDFMRFDAVKAFVDRNLDESEDLLILNSQDLGYVLTNKPMPHFGNQASMFYSSDRMQSLFMRDIREHNVKAVISSFDPIRIWDEMDTVHNEIRIGRLFEYLYDDFRPLGVLDEKVVWLRKDARPVVPDGIELKKYEYPGKEFRLGFLPYYRGRSQANDADWRSVVCVRRPESDKDCAWRSPAPAPVETYRIKIDSNHDGIAHINIGDPAGVQDRVQFYYKRGNHEYVLRTSPFYLSHATNAVYTFTPFAPLNELRVERRTGDIRFE